ncbi:aminotransferase class I/II-fold pyridoxal phosphate-dependent enzyme [bacterium]|nr:MAG: aminotransferase class I/II-fold pyridoxal phosphate-dependent enzyme [bacterium]
MENIFFENFLGPQAENHPTLQNAIQRILEWHSAWRRKFYPEDASLYPEMYMAPAEFFITLDHFLKRLEQQPPYFSPRYFAQMLKDPALSSVIGYLAVILTNPNNHAYEGGPVTTQMEIEVVDDLLKLCGFQKGWGHLCSGGSLANTEAMWAVRDTYIRRFKKPGQVLFSNMSHYSWKRICSILMIPHYGEIPINIHFRMDLDKLETVLKKKPTMMVVANIGTTGCGAVDDVEGILTLRNKYKFHLHLDAAYGGYTRSILLNENGEIQNFNEVGHILKKDVYQSLISMKEADSITIDPHKQGSTGYGCGAVLYKDERLKKVILNTAPYTYHVKNKPNIGMFTLEGSRPGAVAAGCWLTHRMIPLNRNGYGKIIGECLLTAKELSERIEKESGFTPLNQPDLDIFCFYQMPSEKPASMTKMNKINLDHYENFSVLNPESNFILSKFVMDKKTVRAILPKIKRDDRQLVALRSVFIKHWLRMGRPSYLDRLLATLKNNLK